MSATVKDVPATVFLASTARVTIPEIPALADRVIPGLFAAAGQAGLQIAGPTTFLYDGIDGTMTNPFELSVAVPLASAPGAAPAAYTILHAPAIRCIAVDYVGSLNDVSQAYQQLMDDAQRSGLTLTTRCREIYKHWVSYDSPDNVTELQLEVA